MLSVSEYKRQSAAGGHGWVVQFTIDKPAKGKVYTIYQNVRSAIEASDGSALAFSFCECWLYKKKRKIQDSFIVPREWREGLDGRYEIHAQAWAEEGKPDKSFRRGKSGDVPWGTALGRTEEKRPPTGAVVRHAVITWKNAGKKRSVLTRGKDLNLMVGG